MQQFLKINPLTLPSLPLTEKRKLPKLSAIYFALSASGEILYIGRAKNLVARWAVHHRYLELKAIGDIRVAWLECSEESLLPEIEASLIQQFLPTLNYRPYQNWKPTEIDESRKQLIEIVKTTRGSMSQRAFGKLLGVSTTAVQFWEKGVTIPDTENLVKIADRSGYTIDEILKYVTTKPITYCKVEDSELNQILKQIRYMPLSQVAVIAQAVAERLAAVAESSGG